MKKYHDNLLDLIEKEIALFDKRPKKERKIHPSGTCYMNDIIYLVQKEIEKGRCKKCR